MSSTGKGKKKGKNKIQTTEARSDEAIRGAEGTLGHVAMQDAKVSAGPDDEDMKSSTAQEISIDETHGEARAAPVVEESPRLSEAISEARVNEALSIVDDPPIDTEMPAVNLICSNAQDDPRPIEVEAPTLDRSSPDHHDDPPIDTEESLGALASSSPDGEQAVLTSVPPLDPSLDSGPGLVLTSGPSLALHEDGEQSDPSPGPPLIMPPAPASNSWGWGAGFGSNLNEMMGRIQESIKESTASTVKDFTQGMAEFQQALAIDKNGQGEAEKEEEEGWEKVDADTIGPLPQTPPLSQLALREDASKGKDELNPEDPPPPPPSEADVMHPSTLSSWGGLFSGAAKAIASKVEVVSQGISQGALGKIGTSIGSSLEKGLETVGRTAFEIIEDVVAGQFTPPPHLDSIPPPSGTPGTSRGGSTALKGATWGDGEPESFDDFFSLYGGQQLLEEILALCNDSSRTCNRSRSKLDIDQQERLDALVSNLARTFHLPLDKLFLLLPLPVPGEDKVEVAGDKGGDCWEVIEKRYEPIAYLASSCKGKRAGLGFSPSLHLSKRTVADVQDDEATVEEGNQAIDQVKGEVDEKGVDEVGESSSRPGPMVAANKRMAELASAQLQLLNDLALSLAAPSRGYRASTHDLPWPPGPDQQASILRRLVQRMLQDLREASEGFASIAVTDRRRNEEKEVEREEVVEGGVEEGTESGEGTASDDQRASWLKGQGMVAEAFRGMMYCLLVRSLVADVAALGGDEEVENPGSPS